MIRKMTNEDIFSVVKIEQKVLKETLGANFFDNEININPFAQYYVYEINKEIVGYIGSRVYDNSLEIMNFVIKSDYQRRSIGSDLLNYLIDVNKEVTTVTLEVRKSNKQAISFYNKNGFVLETVKKHYYNNEDGYLLVKEVIR